MATSESLRWRGSTWENTWTSGRIGKDCEGKRDCGNDSITHLLTEIVWRGGFWFLNLISWRIFSKTVLNGLCFKKISKGANNVRNDQVAQSRKKNNYNSLKKLTSLSECSSPLLLRLLYFNSLFAQTATNDSSHQFYSFLSERNHHLILGRSDREF